VILVSLFAWLYFVSDIKAIDTAAYPCEFGTVTGSRYAFQYLPRYLMRSKQLLALVGDPSAATAFEQHLASAYPGLGAGALNDMGCTLVDTSNSTGFPSFAGLTTFFASDAALEAYIADENYGMNDATPAIFAAVKFEPVDRAAAGAAGSIHWSYSLRVNASYVPDTTFSSNVLQRGLKGDNIMNWLYTSFSSDVYSDYVSNITDTAALLANTSYAGLTLATDTYIPGALGLQVAVDRFIINATFAGSSLRHATGQHALMDDDGIYPKGAADQLLDSAAFLGDWNCSNAAGIVLHAGDVGAFLGADLMVPQRVAVAPFPTTAYKQNDFYTVVQSVFGLIFVMFFFAPSFFLIRGIVVEKETKIREGVRMMGMGDSALFVAWYITYSIVFTIIALLIAIITKASFFPASDGSLIFAYFWFFGLTAVALCFAISTLFSRAKVASIVGGVLFIAAFFPYFQVTRDGTTRSAKLFGSTLSPVAFGLALDIICSVESNGIGVTHGNSAERLNGYSFSDALGMMIFDFFLYTFVGWYLNHVLPQEFGVPKPALFLCMPRYWCEQRKSAAKAKDAAQREKTAKYAVQGSSTEEANQSLLTGDGAAGSGEEDAVLLLKDTSTEQARHGPSFSAVPSLFTAVMRTFVPERKTSTTGWIDAGGNATDRRGLAVSTDEDGILLGSPNSWRSTTSSPQHSMLGSSSSALAKNTIALPPPAPGLYPINEHEASMLSSHGPAGRGPERYVTSIDYATEPGAPYGLTAGPHIEPVGLALRNLVREERSLVIRGLTKKFETPDGVKTAVNALNLDFVEGQIAALLGHNGAGKTTTISMLTGLIPPTSGDAYAFGDSITTGMESIRKHLGVCPQHDVLWPDLTVKEHLLFFAGIKGVPKNDVERVVMDMIREVGLTEKINALSSDLSGGQKRKLSVGIALIGGSKIVILDEPTSGMDPYSRRFTWNLIQNNREGRVIILTTHFMDEADILGDRIAIMAHGDVRCCGSSMFLKRQYGVGYNLTIIREPSAGPESAQAISSVMHRFIPEAKYLSNVGAEMVFQIPLSASSVFPELFAHLEQGSGLLKVANYGISVTTLEEVFIKVAQEGGVEASSGHSDDNKVNTGGFFGRFKKALGLEAPAALQSFYSDAAATSLQGPVASGYAAPVISSATSGELHKHSFSLSDPPRGGAGAVPAQMPSVGHLDSASVSSFATGDYATPMAPTKLVADTNNIFARHFAALFAKRVRYAKRDNRALCLQLLVPIAILITILALLNQGHNSILATRRAVTLSFDHYNVGLMPGAKDSIQVMGDGSLVQTDVDPNTPAPPNVIPYMSTPESDAFIKYIVTSGNGIGGPNRFAGAAANATFYAIPASVFSATSGPYSPNNFNATNDFMACEFFDPSAFGFSPPVYFGSFEDYNASVSYAFSQWLLENKNATPSVNMHLLHPPSPSRLLRGDHDSHSLDLMPYNDEFLLQAASKYAAFYFDKIGPISPLQSQLSSGAPLSQSGAIYASYVAMANSTAYHAVPTIVNTINSGLFNWLSGGVNSSITTAVAPLPFTKRQGIVINSILSWITVLFIVIAFSFIPAPYAMFIVKEREVNAKHLQLISGVSIPAYWCSTYVWDLLTYMIPCSVGLALLWAFDVTELIAPGSGPATAVLFILFGTAVAPFTYCVSYFFQSHSSAQMMTIFVNLFCFMLLFASFVMKQVSSTCKPDSILRYFYRLLPGYALGDGLFQLSVLKELPFLETNCGTMPFKERIEQKFTAFDMKAAGWPILYLAAESVVYFLLAIGIDIMLSYPAIRAKLLPDKNFEDAPMEVDEDVLAEERRVDRQFDELQKSADPSDVDTILIGKLRKVYNAGMSGQSSGRDARGKVAVKDLSFGVQSGEIFGFLGINGAGKSTTLKILSGDIIPTLGGAFLGGYDILHEQRRVRRLLGYCPQFDALLDLLTVKEHLELFAAIKGVPAARLDSVVMKKMKEMELLQYSNKLAGSLSGGNKRKLSVAIAMIGPAVKCVFLDEASTGMDPVARRAMLGTIARIASGQDTDGEKPAIILTTHSMEECEALSNRVGIMVGGRLRCLGTLQHLKDRFGKGYTALIKLIPAPPTVRVERVLGLIAKFLVAGAEDQLLPKEHVYDACKELGDPIRMRMIDPSGSGWALAASILKEGRVEARAFAEWWASESLGAELNHWMLQTFPGCKLIERHGEFFRYSLPRGDADANESRPLSQLFGLLESAKARLSIAEYSLSQTSLEQIFNSFAAQQEEETGAVRGMNK
jgi:ABC-type multidrug transport system ATPase subunit